MDYIMYNFDNESTVHVLKIVVLGNTFENK